MYKEQFQKRLLFLWTLGLIFFHYELLIYVYDLCQFATCFSHYALLWFFYHYELFFMHMFFAICFSCTGNTVFFTTCSNIGKYFVLQCLLVEIQTAVSKSSLITWCFRSTFMNSCIFCNTLNTTNSL